MIYVVEISADGMSSAWFAYDDGDFIRKVEAGDSLKPWEIHDVSTPRELLALMERTPSDARSYEEFPAICNLGDQYGWDTLLYRADYVHGRGVYQARPVSQVRACTAALQQRHRQCFVYWTDQQAIAAAEGSDPVLAQREHWRARFALHDQLVALEVVADGGS